MAAWNLNDFDFGDDGTPAGGGIPHGELTRPENMRRAVIGTGHVGAAGLLVNQADVHAGGLGLRGVHAGFGRDRTGEHEAEGLPEDADDLAGEAARLRGKRDGFRKGGQLAFPRGTSEEDAFTPLEEGAEFALAASGNEPDEALEPGEFRIRTVHGKEDEAGDGFTGSLELACHLDGDEAAVAEAAENVRTPRTDLADEFETRGCHFLDGMGSGVVDAMWIDGVERAILVDLACHFDAVKAALDKIAMEEEER